jgi:RNA polymerase sigma-70 factor, ECF subfamily
LEAAPGPKRDARERRLAQIRALASRAVQRSRSPNEDDVRRSGSAGLGLDKGHAKREIHLPAVRTIFREAEGSLSHPCSVEASLPGLAQLNVPAEGLDARRIYVDYGPFLWRTLGRLGIAEPDLEDVLQEVLLVVHQRLGSFDPQRSKLTTWLFGICLRVARGHQRRSRKRRLAPYNPVATPEPASSDTPETELLRVDARRRLLRALDGLSVDKRAAFLMFEIEGLSCEHIADVMGVPVGTVHSRIHAARVHFRRALAREGARR